MSTNINLEDVIGFLMETQLFRGLTNSELSEITSVLDIQRFAKDEVIFAEGDVGDAWYVLYEGSVQISKHIPFHKDNKVAILAPPDAFGEMAILDSTPRSATVIAKEDCVVIRFVRRKFERLLEEGTLGAFKLVYGMAKVLSERHREMNEQIASLTQEIEELEAELGERSDVFDRTDMFVIDVDN